MPLNFCSWPIKAFACVCMHSNTKLYSAVILTIPKYFSFTEQVPAIRWVNDMLLHNNKSSVPPHEKIK